MEKACKQTNLIQVNILDNIFEFFFFKKRLMKSLINQDLIGKVSN